MTKVRVIRVLMLLAAWCVIVPASWGQKIATRDLTAGWQVPAERIPGPSNDKCPKVNSSLSSDKGAQASLSQGERLELQIVEISPSQLRIGEGFSATVRLKNTGATAMLVPATADGGQLTGTSSDTVEKYEVGDVSFRLATDKAHRLPVFLISEGALFADPQDKNSYLSLAPGNWIDIKLTGAVECGAEKCLGPLQPDSDAVLTAWWYQRVLTHTVKGCDEDHGAFTVREVDSPPFRVGVHNPPKKADSQL